MGLDKETGYYTLRDILGYNKTFNIVLSQRGIGKSFYTKNFLLNAPGTSMCLYRQQPDMAMAVGDWLDDCYAQGWGADRLTWDGSNQGGWILKLDDKPKIWFRYLTQVNHIKQESFPADMNWVWLDEFIPLAYKKLSGIASEGDAIRAIVKTIDHDTVHSRTERGLTPLRVLMYANPFTWNNPILSYFRVLPRGYGIWKIGPGIVCEMVKPIETDTHERPTVDDFLGDEINVNQGWLNERAFIRPVPRGAVPVATMRIGLDYYVRQKSHNQLWITKTDGHEYSGLNKLGSYDGLLENETAITTDLKNALCIEAYRGRVFYSDTNTKFDYLRDLTALKS